MLEDDKKSKLKKQLGVENLSDDERRALFDKFVDKGGKVLSDKDFEKLSASEKENIKKIVNNIDRNNKSTSDSSSSRINNSKKRKNTQRKKSKTARNSFERKLVERDSAIKRFALNMRCMFSGISSLSGNFKESFFSSFRTEIENSILNLAFIIRDCMNLKRGGSDKFKEEILPQAPLNYELMVRMLNLYNQKVIEDIFKIFTDENKGYLNPITYKNHFTSIFKQIYALRDYRLQCIDAVSIAIEVKRKKDDLPKERVFDYLDKAKNALGSLLSDNYEILLLAFAKSIQRNLHIEDKFDIEKYLNWTEEDIVGNYAKKALEEYRKERKEKYSITSKIDEQEKEEENTEENAEENAEEKEEEKKKLEAEQNNKLSAKMFEGKKIISEIKQNIEKYLDKLGYSDIFKEDERIAKIYVIMEEFEKHFSFILTSSKISFNLFFQDGNKFDFKSELANIYMEFNKARDEMDQYLAYRIEQTEAYKLEHQGNQKARILDSLNTKLKKSERIITDTMYSVSLKLEKSLENILSHSMEIIKEPNKKLKFDNYDGPKRLNGVTSLRAIELCHSLMLAFKILLNRHEL